MTALIIFARNPIAGNVKTRIAKDLGDEAALDIYKKLLEHTCKITSQLTSDKFIFYADFINNNDLWDTSYQKYVQQGIDLGDRMINAFKTVFGKGYHKVAIIGSDCFDLTKAILEQAFESLKDHEFVIGPSQDGGYYLLGMNTFTAHVFENKQWSTDHVFSDTENDIINKGYSLRILPTLSDVDTANDYKKYEGLLNLPS